MTLVLVGGVGELLQGDLDAGRAVVERLTADGAEPGVEVEDLSYGAIAVSQRLEDLRPRALVLAGAVARGRRPGTVTRRRLRAQAVDVDAAQASVRDAGTGYVGIDLVVDVAAAFGSLPARAVAVEIEPGPSSPGAPLSPAVDAAVDAAVVLVRAEVARVPLLDLADRLRPLAAEQRLAPAPALAAMRALLDDVDRLDEAGRWGNTFRSRDRVRLHIAAGQTGDGMEHLDWALWWALIEELDRLEAAEAEAAG